MLKDLRALARTVMAVAALAALSPGDAGAQERVIRMVPRGDVNILDPIWSTVAVTRNFGYMIYDTLFALNERFEPQPQMVGEFSVSADRLTYRMTLRPGLLWHDGAPVRAIDCITSIQRWMRRNVVGQAMAARVAEMTADGDNTIVIRLNAPFDVLGALAEPSNSPPFMMPERVARTDANTQIRETIGSGPFTFSREGWQPGTREVFLRNPRYVPRSEPPSFLAGGKVVNVDRVEWVHINDGNTIMAALQAGEIDYYENPTIDEVRILERDPNIRIFNLDSLGSQGMLRLNHLHPPFNNPRVRQAVQAAIRQEDYMRAVIGDPRYYAQFCGNMFGCGGAVDTDAGSEAIRISNIERARAMLAAAGYNNEPVVVMDPANVPVLHAAVTVTVQNLRRMGFNVDVVAMDVGTMISRRARRDPPNAGGWSVFHTQFQGFEIMSPGSHTYASAGCAAAPPGWPCDEQIEALRNRWLSEGDPAVRRQIAADLQRRAYEVVTYIPIGQFRQPVAHRANITGVLAAGATVFWNLRRQ